MNRLVSSHGKNQADGLTVSNVNSHSADAPSRLHTAIGFLIFQLTRTSSPLLNFAGDVDNADVLRNAGSFYKGSMPRTGKDITSRINVTVVTSTAIGAIPLPYSKTCDTSRPLRRQTAARRTGLGGESFIYFQKGRSVRNRFIAELISKSRPSYVTNRFCHHRFLQAGSVHVSNSNKIETPNNICGSFVMKILSAIRNLYMNRISQTLFLSPLSLPKFFFKVSEMVRIDDLFTIGQNGEVFKTKINSNTRFNFFLIPIWQFQNEIQIPIPLSIFGETRSVANVSQWREWARKEKPKFIPIEMKCISHNVNSLAAKGYPSEILFTTKAKKWTTALKSGFNELLANGFHRIGRYFKFFTNARCQLNQIKSCQPFSANVQTEFLRFVAIVPNEVDGAGLFSQGSSKVFNSVAVG